MKAPLYLVVGARPNFVKLAPLVKVLRTRADIPFQIVNTGQHYDDILSTAFLRILDIPSPDYNLEVGSGSQGVQTARILERFESLLLESPPQGVVVFGDVNSTAACTLASVKLGIPVVHVEAGLRSFDRRMPEEINRIVTDSLSEMLLVSELSGIVNLVHEGISPEKFHFVGNIMIDSLSQMLPIALERQSAQRFDLAEGSYALLTLHRPSNVDDPAVLSRLLDLFTGLSRDLPVLFPAHPRTRKQMEKIGFSPGASSGFRIVDPVDYLDALCLQKQACLVMTDSGGMQEETTMMDIPCLTLRENTERPVTVTLGTSTLVGNDVETIRRTFYQVLEGGYKHAQPIPYWDGHTAGRAAALLAGRFANS